MGAVLHLVKGPDSALVGQVIARQLAAGDRVTVAVLPGAAAPPVPASVTVRRLSDDLSYEELLDLVFAADHVVSW